VPIGALTLNKEASMKTIFLTILLSISSLFANDFALKSVSIRNANFQFEDDQGEISSDTFEANLQGMSLRMANGMIGLGLNETGFDITYQDIIGSFDLEDQSLFKNLGLVDLSGLQLDLVTGEKIHFNVANLGIEIGDGMQELDDVRLLCQRSNRKMNLDLILPCLEDGAMSIKKIILAKESEDTVTKAVTNENMSIGSLDNFYIKIDNKSFKAQLYTTIVFRLKVSLEGSLNFNQSTNEFSLTLDKAKAGWFSVRGKVMEAIKDAGFEGMRVEGNTVYFKL
jgi:hypothetical protein